jgi:hypothetical protein
MISNIMYISGSEYSGCAVCSVGQRQGSAVRRRGRGGGVKWGQMCDPLPMLVAAVVVVLGYPLAKILYEL